ncbi:MAG TPA: hypothetical protein PK185_07660 [Cyclobacteriaceae bacterium]|nr:hypothetical protein [Cyclobacteriaceae bacterium]
MYRYFFEVSFHFQYLVNDASVMILIVASGVNPDIPDDSVRNHHPEGKIVIPNDNFGINTTIMNRKRFIRDM